MVWVCPPQTSINLSGREPDNLAISAEIRFASSGSRYSSTYFMFMSVLLLLTVPYSPLPSLEGRLRRRGPHQHLDDFEQRVIGRGVRLLDTRDVIAGRGDTKINRRRTRHLAPVV